MIISASRRTDIPAYYFDWFLKRVEEGYLYVRNPMNPKQVSKIVITPENTDCIVFWTKNPIPAFEGLKELNQYQYYFQYTLNAYGHDIESNLPPIRSRIRAFRHLSKLIGSERVIWRYDPILLTNKIDVDFHLEYFEKIAKKLYKSTNQVIISIVDDYKKIRNNMRGIQLREISDDEKNKLFNNLKKIADQYEMTISSCAEKIDLSKYGIFPGKCIDDKLISRLLGQDVKIKKDRNQRDVCGCVESVEIGAYNTCLNGCKYCYANYSIPVVNENFFKHDVNSPLLIDHLNGDEKINIRKTKTYKTIEGQLSLFND